MVGNHSTCNICGIDKMDKILNCIINLLVCSNSYQGTHSEICEKNGIKIL